MTVHLRAVRIYEICGASQESAIDSFKGRGDQRILLKDGGCKKVASSRVITGKEERKKEPPLEFNFEKHTHKLKVLQHTREHGNIWVSPKFGKLNLLSRTNENPPNNLELPFHILYWSIHSSTLNSPNQKNLFQFHTNTCVSTCYMFLAHYHEFFIPSAISGRKLSLFKKDLMCNRWGGWKTGTEFILIELSGAGISNYVRWRPWGMGERSPISD